MKVERYRMKLILLLVSKLHVNFSNSVFNTWNIDSTEEWGLFMN